MIKQITEPKNNHWLVAEENDFFVYVGSYICNKIKFQVYLDDYGQSYLVTWINSSGELESWCSGTYNDFENDIEFIAQIKKEK